MSAAFGPREIGVLNACYHACTLVPNRHYLTSGIQQTAAAKRLIERGMLTLAEEQMPMLGGLIVVFLTDENWAAVQAAVQAANKEPVQ